MLDATLLTSDVCSMVGALLLFVVGEVLLLLARRGQRGPARIALLAGSFGNILAGIGVLAGIILVFAGRWSPLTPWLLVSFALIAALMVVARKFVRPWESRVRSALSSDATRTQLKAFASERAALIGRAIVIALFGIVAGLMTMKPALVMHWQYIVSSIGAL